MKLEGWESYVYSQNKCLIIPYVLKRFPEGVDRTFILEGNQKK